MEKELKEEIRKEISEVVNKEIDEMTRLIVAKIENLNKAFTVRFDSLKKVIGDYLELSSNLSIATVKANLKSV